MYKQIIEEVIEHRGREAHGRANGPFGGEVGPAGEGKVPQEETRNGGQIEGGMAEDKGAHIEPRNYG
jgi:hypothetical protein